MEEIFVIISCIEILANDMPISFVDFDVLVDKKLQGRPIHTGVSLAFKR